MAAREAFVTLATTESYCKGATVVGKSLRRHGTTRETVVMVTPNISEATRTSLWRAFDRVVLVDALDSGDGVRLALLGRPELGVTFTKIHCWTLTEYSKGVFLDADTLVLCNVDELFDREELSAAPDPGWPDCFNSGVFVFRPSLETHGRLVEHALRQGSFDGGDQGLLNSFFSRWSVENIDRHLPFVYNLSSSSLYSYRPAFTRFGHDAKIVHFLGSVKPWNQSRGGSGSDFLSLWWDEYQREAGRSQEPAAAAAVEAASCTPEKPQQVPQTAFRENLDSSHSLLARFSAPAEDPAPEVKEVGPGSDGTFQVPHAEDNREEESPSIDQNPVTVATETAAPVVTDPDPESLARRSRWESGQVDYLGRDAFKNIQAMLDRFLGDRK
ncbi:glycogenin-1-like [Salarias fasciatus]|uniref:glycogenin-1-like n=1 Tax=Salarias fasciatus TaxID=181472 RepID=UPI0011768406|nr:glycogenin-1-like [Salarias fasciatus]